MKFLILLLPLLAACSAGNLTINSKSPIRVSECQMTDKAVVTYVQRGKDYTIHPKHAYFGNTILNSGSDFCQEVGWFCGGEKCVS